MWPQLRRCPTVDPSPLRSWRCSALSATGFRRSGWSGASHRRIWSIARDWTAATSRASRLEPSTRACAPSDESPGAFESTWRICSEASDGPKPPTPAGLTLVNLSVGQADGVISNFRIARFGGAKEPLFAPNRGGRALRVALDESSVGSAEDAHVVDLLRGLLRSESVRCWKVADEGPPLTAKRVRKPHGSAVDGWLEVRPGRRDVGVTHDVTYVEGDQIVLTSIAGDIGQAGIWKGDQTYSYLTDFDAAERRDADSVVLGAAISAHCDLLITTRPFLLANQWFPDHGPIRSGPRDAVALVSQYLRLRGEYVAEASPAGVAARFNKGLFYWVGARALLPAGWDWISTFSKPNADGAADDQNLLALTVFQRVARALSARDALRWHSYLPHGNDVADDLLAELDTVLLSLVGAFDALARATHRVCGFEDSERQAGWQFKRWMKQLRACRSDITDVMDDGSVGADMFEVMRSLRNTVHGVGLRPVGIAMYPRLDRQRTVVSVPKEDARLIAGIVRRRGWEDSVGLEDWGEGRMYVSPLALVEHLIPLAAHVLNDIMAVTLGDRSGLAGPPSDSRVATRDAYSAKHQANVLLQLGLETADLSTHSRVQPSM